MDKEKIKVRCPICAGKGYLHYLIKEEPIRTFKQVVCHGCGGNRKILVPK